MRGKDSRDWELFRKVLILVLMEYALRERLQVECWNQNFVLILVLMEVSTYSVEVLLKSLHLLRNRTPRQGATIAMKQLRFFTL